MKTVAQSAISDSKAPVRLAVGRSGGALDMRAFYLSTEKGCDEYAKPPFTVECWAKLEGADYYNVLVANEPRESSAHWELYTDIETGALCAHFSWHNPFEIKSAAVVTDGRWHHLMMQFDGKTVLLFDDGQEVAQQKITPVEVSMPQVRGPLTIGLERGPATVFDCDGVIEQVRISRGARSAGAAAHAASTARFTADQDTVGLWILDGLHEGGFDDLSVLRNRLKLEQKPQCALDDLDVASFKAGPAPFRSPAVEIVLKPGRSLHPSGPPVASLDGTWEMAEGGDETQRLSSDAWSDAISAAVPGSVHRALLSAGLIPDPTVGLQDAMAREKSFKTWWFRKTFPRMSDSRDQMLAFDGVAVKCTVWLNGKELGSHEGMFGGPTFKIGNDLREVNNLVVKIHPAPNELGDKLPNEFFKGKNVGWLRTVVFNNVYGWHYCDIPALGIWRSVRIEPVPPVRIECPYVTTRDAAQGEIDVMATLRSSDTAPWRGTLRGTIEPENFTGEPYHFSHILPAAEGSREIHLRLKVPAPKLWWPNDIGEPHLYRLELSFVLEGKGIVDFKSLVFGIRTIEMSPILGRPNPGRFNWTFVVNGRPMFVKGNGWCTMDPLMDFSRERYDRFLTLAKSQHVQMLRCWGAGMPETDDFYDLCDRKGLMVLQEWPTAWNSHNWQPYAQLEETVRLNTLRLRNHPSLVMWGGGNESDAPVGPAIDMMGRYSIELDGTRPFHRGEPWGGSKHDYTCWWGKAPLDFNLTLTSAFFGEFGVPSTPVYESVQRYLPEQERHLWPPPDNGSFVHHTPVFNKMEDMARLLQYSGYFVPTDSIKNVVLGSQLAQVVGVRHTLERARTRWPRCTGSLYYKMNDNYPAASWSCVDWYGAPKIGHYFFQDAFSPLHACVLFQSLHNRAKDLSVPVFLLDDADALGESRWKVVVKAFDSKLRQVKTQSFSGHGSIDRVRNLGDFVLTAEQTDTAPLLIVVEVHKNDTLHGRTFYFTDYEEIRGSLFGLPKTRLSLEVKDREAIVSNSGNMPAVGVALLRPGHLDTFLPDDNYFWLDAGESKSVGVNSSQGLTVEAWNT